MHIGEERGLLAIPTYLGIEVHRSAELYVIVGQGIIYPSWVTLEVDCYARNPASERAADLVASTEMRRSFLGIPERGQARSDASAVPQSNLEVHIRLANSTFVGRPGIH